MLLVLVAFVEVGGFDGLWRRYPEAVITNTSLLVANQSCEKVSPVWDVMLREATDNDLPWPGFLFGQTPGSIWYWCADQVTMVIGYRPGI